MTNQYTRTHGVLSTHNKILCTPPPHICSSEEILPCHTRCTISHLRTNKSAVLISYLYKVVAKLHRSPLCHFCNSHTHSHDTHYLFNCTHIRTTLSLVIPGFVVIPRRSVGTACQMEGKAGWWTTSGNIGLPPPPLARVKGVGRQQQQVCVTFT